jgi:DNA topoisomerase VI subunit B
MARAKAGYGSRPGTEPGGVLNAKPAALERTTFSFSRAREYFDPKELQAMTGQPLARFPDVLIKELIDNAIDAAETAGVPPQLRVRYRVCGRRVRLAVMDNGPGIPPDTVTRVLDFATRTSDKAHYRGPTRGAQGNALKTVLGIPFALGCKAPVAIEACGVRHVIRATVDPAGEVHIDHDRRDVPLRPGTRVAVRLPARACRSFNPARWAQAFALVNPHASVKIRADQGRELASSPRPAATALFYRPAADFPGGWTKFLPSDPISPHWYDVASLAKLVFAHAAQSRGGGKDLTLRDFVRTFAGLTGTGKAKAVCDRFPAIRRLSDFADEGQVAALLRAMKDETRAPSPAVLGAVGEAHLRARLDRWFGVRRWWYKKVSGTAGGLPFVVEVALAETRKPGRLFHAVNFSPTFDDPLANTRLYVGEVLGYGIAGFLGNAHALPGHGQEAVHTAAAVHLTCPALQFLDRGKTRLRIDPEMAAAVAGALWSVAKTMYKEGERRKKDAARQEKADRERERQAHDGELTLVEAVERVLPEAHAAATGGQYEVSAHTLFYHVRPRVQPYTRRELKSHYFEQDLLPAYQREHGALDPPIYYEPRGTLYEPHTGVAVPLGTREVDEYRFPAWLYDKILFVEKQGLWPILSHAKLAERYDMAIVAGEGYATEACRVLFRYADQDKDYQIFVLHDADPWGYNICRTLREETARMPGYRVKVTDLGLFLKEALDMGLPTEEFTRKKGLPEGLQLTPLEREHFVGRKAGPKSWVCRRVELNALSAPELVAYIERRLGEEGVRGKVIPPPAELPRLAERLYRQLVGGVADTALADLLKVETIKDRLAEELRQYVPLDQAREWAERGIVEDPACSWGKAIGRQVQSILVSRATEVMESVRRAVSAVLGTPP